MTLLTVGLEATERTHKLNAVGREREYLARLFIKSFLVYKDPITYNKLEDEASLKD